MIRLAVRVSGAQAESVLADLLELAPHGVEEVSHSDGTVEYAVYGAPGELPVLPDLRAAAGEALVQVSTSELPDDWEERWRKFHRPLVLGSRLVVRPPWEPPRQSDIDVVIDPGMAFGTGGHATTRLCLEALLELAGAGLASGSFLDLGCGSGVLAITAALLGWSPIVALDHDPLSIQATEANAARNGVAVEARRFDLRHQRLPAADTVAANLLGPLLRDLATGLQEGARGPSRLIASGLLVSEADEIAAAFARGGLKRVACHQRAEWAALLLESPAGVS